MASLRETPFTQIASLKVLKFSDYQNSVSVDTVTGEKTILTLPKSNVLAFDLEDNAQVIVRPSGTEPKIKVYYTAKAENLDLAKELVKTMSADVKARF
jgi:phosphoglucomutase